MEKDINPDDLGIPPDPLFDQALAGTKMISVMVSTYYQGLIDSGIEKCFAKELTIEFNHALSEKIMQGFNK